MVKRKGSLMWEIKKLLEVQKRYMELLEWHIEHAEEVMEIENRGLRGG